MTAVAKHLTAQREIEDGSAWQQHAAASKCLCVCLHASALGDSKGSKMLGYLQVEMSPVGASDLARCCVMLHAPSPNDPPEMRDAEVERLLNREAPVALATDVTARGFNFPEVSPGLAALPLAACQIAGFACLFAWSNCMLTLLRIAGHCA